jgi:hypothetical protein
VSLPNKSRARCVCGRMAKVLIGSLFYCPRHARQIEASRAIARRKTFTADELKSLAAKLADIDERGGARRRRG